MHSVLACCGAEGKHKRKTSVQRTWQYNVKTTYLVEELLYTIGLNAITVLYYISFTTATRINSNYCFLDQTMVKTITT